MKSKEEQDEDKQLWWRTQEGHRIIECMKAATLEKDLYAKQAERIKNTDPNSRAFQAFFNTSVLGIGVEKAGMGRRGRDQAKFKRDLQPLTALVPTSLTPLSQQPLPHLSYRRPPPEHPWRHLASRISGTCDRV